MCRKIYQYISRFTGCTKNNYYNDIIENGDFESETRISQATMDLLLAKRCVREVKKFTEKEKDEMTTSFLKGLGGSYNIRSFLCGSSTAASRARALGVGSFAM